MLNRFAPLVPLALVTLLFGCASHPQQVAEQHKTQQQSQAKFVAAQSSTVYEEEVATEKELADFAGSKPYQLPVLADSILERGMSLIGTRYRFGGTSEAGFDCSGFIGYLFREEAGMNLPRSTREMINVKAPLVARNNLKPGDLLFFSTAGRGRVSHAGIYLGELDSPETWRLTTADTPGVLIQEQSLLPVYRKGSVPYWTRHVG